MSPEIHDEFEWDELPALFPDFEDPGRWLPLLRRHLVLVEEAAPHTRVTSVPAREAVRRHYAESLELLRVACSRARSRLPSMDAAMIKASVLPSISGWNSMLFS